MFMQTAFPTQLLACSINDGNLSKPTTQQLPGALKQHGNSTNGQTKTGGSNLVPKP